MNFSQTICQRRAATTGWDHKLHLYTDEIHRMMIRLQEISQDNHYPEFEAGAAYFQEQFLFFIETIHEINGEIRHNKRTVSQPNDRSGERLRIFFFEKNFTEFRANFRWFCANWM